MANVTVNPASWLNLSSLLELSGFVFWDSIDYPDITFSDDDIYITVNQNYAKNPDLIPVDYYGDTAYLWAVLLANDIDLPNQIIEGEQIRIPAKATIDKILDSNS